MPKSIVYSCVNKTAALTDVFVGENEVTTISVDFTGAGVDAWAKWIDIVLANKTGEAKLLGTNIIETYLVEDDFLALGGKVMIYPYAISITGNIQKFAPFTFNVQPWNEIAGTVISDPSVITALQDAIAHLEVSKSETTHLHDDRYYTETEADALLAGKAPTVHAHDDLYYTEDEADALFLTKVDKAEGQSLMLDAEHTKLAGIETGAEVNNMSDVDVAELTGGADSDLHHHDGRYYTALEMDAMELELDGRLDVLENNVIVTGEPTGFTNNDDIVVSYNPTTRKVTLTGTFEAYYKGVKVSTLTNGWVSDAHPDVQANYYLYYCESGFVFSTTTWDFTCLMIAFIQYNSHQLGIRETHGFMPHTTHEHLHQTIGAFKKSGGDFTGFTLTSTTPANRRPNISDTYCQDEDLTSLIPALSTKLYTHRFLTGAGATRSFNVDQAEILPVSGNQPYYNQNNGGTWQQTLFGNNEYGAIFVVALPATADTQSQKYRYMFVQPQKTNASLQVIQALTPTSLVHGDSSSLVSEFVFIGRIIVRYTGGNWTIVQVDKLDGTKISQVSYSAGNYLSIVSHDTTLTGDGTAVNPLVVANDQHTHDGRYYTETEIDAMMGDVSAALDAILGGA